MTPVLVWNLDHDPGLVRRLIMIVDLSRLNRTDVGSMAGYYETLISRIERGKQKETDQEQLEKIAAVCAGQGYLWNQTAEQLLDYIINGEDRPFGASPNPTPSGGGEPIDLSEKRTSRRTKVRPAYPMPKTRVAA